MGISRIQFPLRISFLAHRNPLKLLAEGKAAPEEDGLMRQKNAITDDYSSLQVSRATPWGDGPAFRGWRCQSCYCVYQVTP